MQRANWVSALVEPVPPSDESSNSGRGVPEVSRTPPEKFPNQIKGKGALVPGRPVPPPPYLLPESNLTHGAGDQREANNLKSPRLFESDRPTWAVCPGTSGPAAKLK